MEKHIDWIDPSSLEGLTDTGVVYAISFKEWVDVKYNDTNLVLKYSDKEEQIEFLYYVIKLMEDYKVSIIPEYEKEYSPEYDVTKLRIKGTISGEKYFEGNLSISSKDFLVMFIESEMIHGTTELNSVDLVSILS